MTLPNWHIHLPYWLLILIVGVGGWIGVHSWVAEHDWAVKAQAAVEQANAQVKTLQQGIADRDAQAVKQQQVIVKVVHDTVTPQQAVQNLPQVVTAPLPAPVVSQPSGDMLIPAPDVLPIFQQLADDKICRSQLDTTTKDLTDTKAIVVARDAEIVVLKKPKGFWKRVGGTMKAVGVGIGIGLALGHHV